MEFGYDCAASALLCAEDSNSVLGFDDNDGVEAGVEVEKCGVWGERFDLLGEFLHGFPLQSEESLVALMEREVDHLPRADYAERLLNGGLDLAIRRDAIEWISKVHAHYGFGPLSAYLSVNYMDRFLSAYELPQGKAWTTQLLSVACLSLAAKMEETEVPLSLDLQLGDSKESKYVFEARTIQRMELLVLSTLKWRMQAVTPFSYIDFFLHRFNDGNPPSGSLICRSVELILCLIRGTGFLTFKPSEIAAAVALYALGETQTLEIRKALSCSNHVQKERVLSCCELIQESILMRSKPFKDATPSVSSVPQSPIGVLDAACLSYKSDDTTAATQQAEYNHTSPVPKRRRLNRS